MTDRKSEYLADPRTAEKILATVKKRLRNPADADDASQDAFVALSDKKTVAPPDFDQWLGLVHTVAVRAAVNKVRKEHVQGKHRDDGANVEEIGRESIPEAEKQLIRKQAAEFVKEAVADGGLDPKVVEAATAVSNDESLREVGEQQGVSDEAARKRLKRSQESLAKRWYAFAGVVSALTLGVCVFLFRQKADEERHAQWVAEQQAQTLARDRARLEEAAQLRAQAQTQCTHGNYAECTRLLDEARQRDPLSEERADVRDLRQQVIRSRDVTPVSPIVPRPPDMAPPMMGTPPPSDHNRHRPRLQVE